MSGSLCGYSSDDSNKGAKGQGGGGNICDRNWGIGGGGGRGHIKLHL